MCSKLLKLSVRWVTYFGEGFNIYSFMNSQYQFWIRMRITIICFVDYSQEYLEIVQFSRLATLRHFMNSDCFLCYYNLLLQSLWKDIHLFFLPNCVSFIVDWYQRLRCFWQMTHRHRYWKIRSKSISLALQKFRIKVDVIANVDRPYNGKMHLLPY